MIRIDPLTMLFFLEFALICLIAAVALFWKSRKYKLLYTRVLRDLTNLKAGGVKTSSPKQEQDAGNMAALNAKPAEEVAGKKELEEKVAKLEATLKEETKLLEDLKKKHASLENEYAILYGKHFEGKGGDTGLI